MVFLKRPQKADQAAFHCATHYIPPPFKEAHFYLKWKKQNRRHESGWEIIIEDESFPSVRHHSHIVGICKDKRAIANYIVKRFGIGCDQLWIWRRGGLFRSSGYFPAVSD